MDINADRTVCDDDGSIVQTVYISREYNCWYVNTWRKNIQELLTDYIETEVPADWQNAEIRSYLILMGYLNV